MAKAAIARQVAFDVLEQVARGGYASELLIGRTASLDTRDAGLAAEITLGVLRRQAQLDFLIEKHSGRPLARLDAEVVIALRMALYQTQFLDRVPAYAAVNDSLNLLRSARKLSAIGFANAVLRNSTREKATREKAEIPADLAVPGWLLAKWSADFGPEMAAGIANASLTVPPLYQHVPAGCDPPPGAHPTEVTGCWRVEAADPRYRVQDIGSQAIVPLLELKPGLSLLDVCSAPGNKTLQALELTQHIVAADLSLERVRGLKPLQIPLVVMDAREPLPFSRRFDRILVDAPCTGTGTLAHNPEIKWRLQAADAARFAHGQQRILRNSLAQLAPGGCLVYSTCSLEPEENEAVVRAVAANRIQQEIRRVPGREPGDGFYAAVIR